MMKRIFSITLLLLAICLFSACGPQSTPRQVVKTYWTDLQNEKYSEAVDLYYDIDGLFSEDGRELLAALMKVEMATIGKITKVEVVSVDKGATPDKATVTVELTTEGSSSPRTETMDVVKFNGKWYIDFEI